MSIDSSGAINQTPAHDNPLGWTADHKEIIFTRSGDNAGHFLAIGMDGKNQREFEKHVRSSRRKCSSRSIRKKMRTTIRLVILIITLLVPAIWILDLATGEAHKLADHDQPYLDKTPSWFPDGRQIVFQSDRTGKMEVWEINADGSNQRQVTGTGNSTAGASPAQTLQKKAPYYFNPDWSPDGSRILFESTTDGKFALYTISPDGSNLKKLTSGEANDEQPCWSRDGRQIVFISDQDGHLQLYLMNADGSERHRLTNAEGLDYQPDFSPKGDAVIFEARLERAATRHNIYVIRTDGAGRVRLTDESANSEAPRWSPDGRRIVFVRDFPSAKYRNEMSKEDQANWRKSQEIFVMNKDGTGVTNLTHNNVPEWSPAWSRDGKRVYFMSERDGARNLYDMKPDGSDERKIFADQSFGPFSAPAISPNGKYFAYANQSNGKWALYLYEIESGKERLLIGGMR